MNTVFQTDSYKKIPPMLEQYIDYKKAHADCLIFCQVGDFYELFFDDAVTVSRELNLTLTSRDKNNDNPVPMCGVPIAVIDSYVDRLVDLGYSVAIISQAELSQDAKGMVKRKLERIITPAVRLLGEKESASSVVASVYFDTEKNVSIAFLDVQNAKVFYRENLLIDNIKIELNRISPREIIVLQVSENKRIDRRTPWLKDIEKNLLDSIIKIKPESYISTDISLQRNLNDIIGYSALSNVTKKAVKLLLNYIDDITVEKTISVREISQRNYENIMGLDAGARKNLELIVNQKDNSKKNTLFDYMDKTITVGGEKLLRSWILSPLLNIEQINDRQKGIEFFKENVSLRYNIRKILKYICNFERIASRLELCVISPKEMGALRDSMEKIPNIIMEFQGLDVPFNIKSILEKLKTPQELRTILDETLKDNPSNTLNEGNIIKDGFSKEVDELRYIRQNGCSWILDLEQKEKNITQINSLKIRFNNVLGYYIEVTKANKDKVPNYYIPRQSTTNAERFFTEELKKRENEVLGAETKLFSLERELFIKLREKLLKYVEILRELGEGISLVDLYGSLAELAEEDNLICPKIVADKVFDIKDGVHPVLKSFLKSNFIPNSLFLSNVANMAILTGPNMGGKSTFLRQCALIVIMAQMGSFVPASTATIGIVDKIFARLGASDDMQEGESTFMVEMREASNILSNATEKSFVLIDEIGRGTATTDGLSIAQSILEYLLLNIKCRTIFATHFHELTLLTAKYKQLKNLSVASVEKGNEIIFTHEIISGAAKKSYGIHVAKLAGISNVILKRANQVLKSLDNDFIDDSDQVSIFESNRNNDEDVESLFKNCKDNIEKLEDTDDVKKLKEVSQKIKNLNVNTMTPIEALSFLNNLKEIIE